MPQRLPGGSREPSEAEKRTEARKAELLALVNTPPGAEADGLVVEEPSPEVELDAPTEEVAEEPSEEAEETPGPQEEVAEEAPKKKKGSVWEAVRAAEERSKAEIAEARREAAEREKNLRAEIEALKPKPHVEQDPEVEAWNEAILGSKREFIDPELQAIRNAQFEERLEIGQALAAITRPDYFDVVKLGDPTNAVERYLADNPDKAREIGRKGAKDIGAALYDLGMELRERDPSAKEAWREAERKKLYDEVKAEIMGEVRKVVKKEATPVKPGSMIAGNVGGGAPSNGPVKIRGGNLTRAQLLALANGQGGND